MNKKTQPTDLQPGGAAEPSEVAGVREAPRKPLQEPDGGWPADEYTGMAGSYVRDPFTGVRRPAGDA